MSSAATATRIGYLRAMKVVDDPLLAQQRDALLAHGCHSDQLFVDQVSSRKDGLPALSRCLHHLRPGDVLVVWRLERLGSDLRHLVRTVNQLIQKDVALQILTSCAGPLSVSGSVCGSAWFEALSEFEQHLVQERARVGLAHAKNRGRHGGRKFSLSAAQIRYAQTMVAEPDSHIGNLCEEIGCSRSTLYRYVDASGALRDAGRRALQQHETTSGN